MSHMKFVKNLLDTGRYVQLRKEYVNCQSNQVIFDGVTYDKKYVEAILDFIDKNEDAHQSTRNEIL